MFYLKGAAIGVPIAMVVGILLSEHAAMRFIAIFAVFWVIFNRKKLFGHLWK